MHAFQNYFWCRNRDRRENIEHDDNLVLKKFTVLRAALRSERLRPLQYQSFLLVSVGTVDVMTAPAFAVLHFSPQLAAELH